MNEPDVEGNSVIIHFLPVNRILVLYKLQALDDGNDVVLKYVVNRQQSPSSGATRQSPYEAHTGCQIFVHPGRLDRTIFQEAPDT